MTSIAVIVSFIAFGIFAALVGTNSVSGFDDPIIKLIQGWESPGLTSFMETISMWGTTWYVVSVAVVVMLLLALLLGQRKELLLFAAALIGSTLLNNIAKGLFERERPSLHRLIEEEGFGFPSGHSMASFTLAVITAYLLWKHISSSVLRTAVVVLAVAWFVLMGTSRIYLGVHYPSDVIAGYLLSATWAGIMITAFRGWIARDDREEPTFEYALRNIDQ
ncbi:phosphatase PAP2 family protein [Cohnella fermenti]|nr:phosphatase PAP2 family protein [Cohnella fermenti]